MDSKSIAHALEEEFPQPSLHLDSPILPQVEQVLLRAFQALAPDFLPEVPKRLLNPPSAEYFARTRAVRFGESLEEVQKNKGGQAAWDAAEPHLLQLAALLKEAGGPFFMGDTGAEKKDLPREMLTDPEVSYADFYIVGFLQFAKRLGKLERAFSYDSAFRNLYEASAKWLERDDR